MRNFDYAKLSTMLWDTEILSYIAKIHEYKGRQALYLRQKPMELERLVEVAKIQSTEASNRIEGIITTKSRLKQLCEDKTTPKNRDEKEILGYRNALNLIHENYPYIPVKPNYILQLHKELLKFTNLSYGGIFKNTANEIDMRLPDGTMQIIFKPLLPYETPQAIENICASYENILNKELVDPLLLIPCFILDFLCIHPSAQIVLDDTMDLQIRITADRRSKMTVILTCQSKMSGTLRAVFCLFHAAQGQSGDHRLFGSSLNLL